MNEILKSLCMIDGASGDEAAVREYVISQIKDFCYFVC